MTEKRAKRKLAAVMAADVAGYSRLMGANEEGTLDDLMAHLDGIFRPCIAEHGGRLVKTTGDGVLAEFSSVVAAVQCAVGIQEAMSQRNSEVTKDRRIEFRIGINVGDVIERDDDLFGDGVNVAARLEGLAEAGGICISDMVYQGVRSQLDLSFEDLGPQRLKNIGAPVHAFRIRTGGSDDDVLPEEPDNPPLPDKPSIAVLPFDNISGDPEQEYFSDGITEDIITELSKISGLFVIARHSVFAYKGKPVNLRQVGRELGVRYLLEGSVRRAGNRLRITAQLIDANTDHHVWAERYDRDMEDIFEIQEEVARNVASSLTVALNPEEGERIGKAPTANIEAYDIFMRTRASLWPPTRENLFTARSAYRRIAELDPTFAGGPAGQSLTHSMAVMFSHTEDPEEDRKKALELAAASLELDADFAQAHAALGVANAVSRRFDDAVACALRAAELQPGDADVHLFATFCHMFACDFDTAGKSILTALRLDPQFIGGPYLNVLGCVWFCAGRYEDSLDALQRNIDRGGPLAPPALMFRTASYSALGRMEQARETAKALLIFFPAFSISAYRFFRLYKEAEVTERWVAALAKAGLPE